MTEEKSVKTSRPLLCSQRCYRFGLEHADGSVFNVEPALEHLMVTSETKDELMPFLTKLCADDWSIYVHCEKDLREERREQLMKYLEEKGWKIEWNDNNIIEGILQEYDSAIKLTNISVPCEEVEV